MVGKLLSQNCKLRMAFISLLILFVIGGPRKSNSDVSQCATTEYNSKDGIVPSATSVVGTIPIGLGGIAPFAIGVNPATNRIYLANAGSNNVSVIDGATNTVIGNPVPVGVRPFGISVNPNTNLIYV